MTHEGAEARAVYTNTKYSTHNSVPGMLLLGLDGDEQRRVQVCAA